VVCQRVSRDGNPIDVDDYHCPPTERPPSERTCNEGACPTVRIRRQSMKFFQLNKMDKVRPIGWNDMGPCSLLPVKGVVVEWSAPFGVLNNGKDTRRNVLTETMFVLCGSYE